MRLEGKVVLVTGGARGIGEAISRLFLKEGAIVAIGDIREEEGRKLVEELGQAKNSAEVCFVKLNVSSSSDWDSAVKSVLSKFGKLNVLVNNAGISDPKLKIEDTTEESWEKVMSVNARGVFLGTRSVIVPMRKEGGGSIVNVSSQFGIVGTDFENPAYQASKGAITIFTKVTALQYSKDGIRANSLHPGPIDTPSGVIASNNIQRLTTVLSKVPLGRIGRPEEIAYGALFLASDESSFMTGAELVIDGGYTCQ